MSNSQKFADRLTASGPARTVGKSRRPSGRSHQRCGAAVVELAFVLPLLLLLFVITVDFARVYYNAQVITDAARVGARYAADIDLADSTSYESVADLVAECTSDLGSPPTVIVTTGKDSEQRQYVEVTVSQKFRLITPLWLQSEYTVSRKARALLFPSTLMEQSEA
jgi:TadE-like protein